jgi:3-oxoadipate enol-lactonase
VAVEIDVRRVKRETFETRGRAGTLVGVSAGHGARRALPIVFVHGINMSSDVWSDVFERLTAERLVVAFDLRGHGKSDRSGPFGAADYADDTLSVMDHLRIARAHLVGTSFGGAVACVVAARAPSRVASILAIGSALRVEGLDVDGAVAALRAAGVRPFFASFLPQASFAPGTDAAIIERALDAASANREIETVVDVSTTALATDMTEVAREVRAPALVVTGELDATCPVAAGRAMANALGAEHRVLPGRGHVAPLEDPVGTARWVSEYVSSVESR